MTQFIVVLAPIVRQCNVTSHNHAPASQLSQSIPPEPRRQPSSWRLSSSSSGRAAAGRWPGHNTKHEKHATDTRTQGEAAVVREGRGDASMSSSVTCLVCLLLARLHPALAAVVGNDTEYDEYEEFLHPVQVRSRAKDSR